MSRSLASLLCSPLLLPALAAADVSPATTFGSGCVGASGVEPSITAPPFAVTGEPLAIEIDSGVDISGFLLVSTQKDTWLGFDLPLELGDFDAPGCDLLVPPDVSLPLVTDGDGRAVLELTGPAPGQTIFLQAFMLDTDPEDFVPLVAFSEGVELPSVAASGLESGAVVITEIMKDPAFVTDANGEWFEVYNPGEQPIDLTDWCLVDDSGQLVVLASEEPIEVPPFGYALLGNNADPGTNGGVELLVDYSSFGSFTLSNNADTIRLVTPDGIVIDEVSYGTGNDDGWLDPVGASLELAEGVLEVDVNDDGSVWEQAQCFIGGGVGFNTDLGSPGAPTGTCFFSELPQAGGELIFSEVMQNPQSVSDVNGEWFEVFNTTSEAIDMEGYAITLGGGGFTVEGSLVVEPGGYQLFVRVDDPALNGGLPAGGYDYPDSLALPNSSQGLRVTDAAGDTVCFIEYDNGLSYPDPSGASMALDPAQLTLAGSEDGTAWCVSSTVYGDGDRGTPGTPNDSCE